VYQCYDLKTKVSRLECTRVCFAQVSVVVSISQCQGLDLGLKTSVQWFPYFQRVAVFFQNEYSQEKPNTQHSPRTWRWFVMLPACSSSWTTFPVYIFNNYPKPHLFAVLWSREQGLKIRVHWSSFYSGLGLETSMPRSWSWSQDLSAKVLISVSRPQKRSWQQHCCA